MKKQLFLLLVPVLVFSACRFVTGKRIQGNGNVTTENRSQTGFEGVESHGAFNVYVSTGSPASVKIEAEENLLPYIETYVENNVLKVRTKRDAWLKTSREIKVYVTAPVFKKIESNGSGNIISQTKLTNPEKIVLEVNGSADIDVDVDAPEVTAEVNGSGNMKLRGETKTFKSESNGSGNVKAMDLKAEDTEVEVTGSGNAEVYASVKLDVRVVGSGDIRYKGNAQVSSKITGSGSVRKVD